jgi:hypothetical protein
MNSETFTPLLTAEIPPPVVDPGTADEQEGPLPRSLAQAAGKTRARRGTLLVMGMLLLQAALEGILLVKLSDAPPLVVFQPGSRDRLVGR